MRRTARVSSQSTEARTGPATPPRPEAPPVPDESFWNDAGERAEGADWMDALAESGTADAAAQLPVAPAEDTDAPSPPRRASAFAAVTSDWVEPVTDVEPAATADRDAWAEPVAPVAPLAAATADLDAFVDPTVVVEPVAAPVVLPVAPPVAPAVAPPIPLAVVPPTAPITRIGPPPSRDDEEIVFTPVPVADVVPIRPEADAEQAADNLSWLDADGLDDLLPPA